ncbi:MAG: sigma-54 dependent transcriptional regulator [Myxococcota bacterium]
MSRVLVADDEEGVRSFLADALSLDGHEVVEVADGLQALEALGREAFHVLVTDLKMPGMDGIELLRRVRAEFPEVEVILLTAYGTVDRAVEAMKLGAVDFLQKPLSGPAELRVLVRRASERRHLRDRVEVSEPGEVPPLTWGSPAMKAVVDVIGRVAATDATVLLLGESGVGKEVAARAIHARSARRKGPFVAINCAALSENLLESELFGHEKGAFTGAAARKRGKLELAEGGTFFLDEAGELKPDLQARLLRVLQERRFERVGGTQLVHADVRWIAATNQDLQARVASGHFRADLYYRLAVFPIRLPALRDRPEDLVPLAQALLARVAHDLGRPGLRLDEPGIRALRAREWPGNVRELGNALERAAILSDGLVLDARWLEAPDAPVSGDPPGDRDRPDAPTSMEALERDAIRRALVTAGGNRRLAAEQLGIGLRTLYEKLKRFDLG